MTIRIGGHEERVRLVGIDAPEKDQVPWGPRAGAFLRGLVSGKEARVETDVQPRDRYGRTLGYLYVGKVFVNLELVRQGYAMLYTYPPNVAHQAEFLAAQREARAAKSNIWSPIDGLTITPYEHRHRRPAPSSIGQEGLPARAATVASGDTAADQQAFPDAEASPFVGNRRSRRYHAASCPLAGKIAPHNREPFTSARAAEEAGMRPCGSCHGRP